MKRKLKLKKPDERSVENGRDEEGLELQMENNEIGAPFAPLFPSLFSLKK